MNRVYIIAVYIRLSIEDGDLGIGGKDESSSIVNQRNMIRSFISSKQEFSGSQVIELCDDGYTGLNFERPAMKELLRMTKEKKVDCIIVKDFSRFGRDYLKVSDFVDQIFPCLGVRFISLNDGYDSKNLNGTTSGLDVAFRNIVYAYYSKDISEKVQSGKRTKARRGAYLSPFAPMGYQKDKMDKNHLVVEQHSAKIVKRIFQMSGAGLSVMEIARILNAEKVPTPSMLKKSQGFNHKWWNGLQGENLWDTSSITRILRDERYLGTVVYGKKHRPELGNYRVRKTGKENWIIVPGCHEPIVTEEEFQAAQQTLRTYTEVNGRKSSKHLFIGKIRCGICGYSLIGEGKIKSKYRCLTSQRTSGYDCSKLGIMETDLAETVWEAIRLYCKTLLVKKEYGKREYKPDRISGIQRKLAIYQDSVKNIDEQKAILYEKMLDGVLSREQYISKRDGLLKQQEDFQEKVLAFEKQLDELRMQEPENTPSIEELKKYLHADELTREIVMGFVDCIYVYSNAQVNIKWLFDIGLAGGTESQDVSGF